MKKKINLYDLLDTVETSCLVYINKKTNQIIEEYTFEKLSKYKKNNYILITNFKPKIKDLIKDFLSVTKNTKTFKLSDTASDFEIMDIFHCWAEENRMWVDFLDYKYYKEIMSAQKWCVDNNFEYFYEEPFSYLKKEAFKFSEFNYEEGLSYELLLNILYKNIKVEYIELLKNGNTSRNATMELVQKNKWVYDNDNVNTMFFWLMLANIQCELGTLNVIVKEITLDLINNNKKLLEIKKSIKKYYKNKSDELQNLKEKINSAELRKYNLEPLKEKNINWKTYDVYAYQLNTNYAKSNGLFGRYLILIKIDNYLWKSGDVSPVLLAKITKNTTLPHNLKEINNLEFIQNNFIDYERRAEPYSNDSDEMKKCYKMWNACFPTDEYGLLPVYRFFMGLFDYNELKEKLVFLGNFENIILPINEFIPRDNINLQRVTWRNVEIELIEKYINYNKRKASVYRLIRKGNYNPLVGFPVGFIEKAEEYKKQNEAERHQGD